MVEIDQGRELGPLAAFRLAATHGRVLWAILRGGGGGDAPDQLDAADAGRDLGGGALGAGRAGGGAGGAARCARRFRRSGRLVRGDWLKVASLTIALGADRGGAGAAGRHRADPAHRPAAVAAERDRRPRLRADDAVRGADHRATSTSTPASATSCARIAPRPTCCRPRSSSDRPELACAPCRPTARRRRPRSRRS